MCLFSEVGHLYYTVRAILLSKLSRVGSAQWIRLLAVQSESIFETKRMLRLCKTSFWRLTRLNGGDGLRGRKKEQLGPEWKSSTNHSYALKGFTVPKTKTTDWREEIVLLGSAFSGRFTLLQEWALVSSSSKQREVSVTKSQAETEYL